jgi:DnaJ family protein A protein 5
VASKDTSDAETEATDKAPDMSKRDKRRAREAKKKTEEEAAKLAFKEARKEAKKAAKSGEPPAPQTTDKRSNADDKFVLPKQKKKGKQAKVETVVVTDDEVARSVADITALRAKMVDKWAADWTGEANNTGRLAVC